MYQVHSTQFEEIKIIENFYQRDIRGSFTKTFNSDKSDSFGMHIQLQEIYYSISNKNVIRGMHFQLPPYDYDKIVHIVCGSVVDVVVDLRKSSKNYRQFIDIRLSGNDPRSLYIPRGFAHGFKCLVDNTIILYHVTKGYNPAYDTGILYDSFGYDWGIKAPIISEKDENMIPLNQFESPF